MEILEGNIIHVDKGIIIHQLSNKRVMNLGVAKEIRSKYPQHYVDYLATPMILGNIVVTKVSSKLAVIGIISQNGYGHNPDVKYTQEGFFKEGLLKVKNLLKDKSISVYLPYLIGCGYGNGNWEVISSIIEEVFPDAILVKYVK